MPIRQTSNSLLHDLGCFYQHLSRLRRFQLGGLLILLVASSLSEMVTVGAIFPFLSALGHAQDLIEAPQWQTVFYLLRIDTTQRLVLMMALGFIVALGISSGLRLLTLRMQLRLAAAVATDISSEVYRTTLYQPYEFHIQQNTSDLVQTLTLDMDRVTRSICVSLLILFANALMAPALIITLMIIDWKIAIGAALILGTAYIFIFRIRQRLLSHNSDLYSQAGQNKVKVVQEGIGGIREVLLAHSQPFFYRIYRRHESVMRQAVMNNAIIAQSPAFMIEFIALGSIALLSLSLGQGDDFSQAIPVLGSLALGAKRLIPALQAIFASVTTIQGAQASLSRVLVALNLPINPLMQLSSEHPLGLQKELQLEGVWFRYKENADWVLRNLCLSIEAKKTIALVGSTGSGKSTAADLILGLLQPQQGKILLDGMPLVGKRLRRWQAAIAHVPQYIYLSDSTLLENIAFGIPAQEIDFKRVQQAAELAHIAGFIKSLPAGYETYVGEQGIRLSGGQQQRIGIARALYRQASLILFDEATSALDNATEKEVMEAIEGLSGEFTIILIAHRLSTIKNCDLVIELEQGKVVAQGSYEELLACSESFQRMTGTI